MHRTDLPARSAVRFARLEMASTALLVIDMQNAFMRAGEVFANPHALDIVADVNRLAAAMRAAGGAVLWTRQTIVRHGPQAYPAWQFDESIPFVRAAMDALSAGAEGHALHAAMAVADGDAVIDKHRYSAFVPGASGLHAHLQAHGIDTLVIAGTLTNVCCDSSARDAQMMGYKVLFAADATAAASDEEHNAALLTLGLHFVDLRRTQGLIDLLAVSR